MCPEPRCAVEAAARCRGGELVGGSVRRRGAGQGPPAPRLGSGRQTARHPAIPRRHRPSDGQIRRRSARPHPSDQTRPDRRYDQTRPDQIKPDQPGQTRPGQTRSNQTRPDQIKPDQARPDQIRVGSWCHHTAARFSGGGGGAVTLSRSNDAERLQTAKPQWPFGRSAGRRQFGYRYWSGGSLVVWAEQTGARVDSGRVRGARVDSGRVRGARLAGRSATGSQWGLTQPSAPAGRRRRPVADTNGQSVYGRTRR